jgi:hypothetical protein
MYLGVLIARRMVVENMCNSCGDLKDRRLVIGYFTRAPPCGGASSTQLKQSPQSRLQLVG